MTVLVRGVIATSCTLLSRAISARAHRSTPSVIENAATSAATPMITPVVESVVRVSEEYRVLGRHKDDHRPSHFEYQGLRFGQDTLHVFAGLCAVDTREHVEQMVRTLRDHGQVCTRMGAYKPRTSPYSFQGHGASCLSYVFEMAGKYAIKVVAMEITHESQIGEINDALEGLGGSQQALHETGLTVDPHQLKGIELNPRAAAITPMVAIKSSTLSSLSVLVVTFLKYSPAFFPVADAAAGGAPRPA